MQNENHPLHHDSHNHNHGHHHNHDHDHRQHSIHSHSHTHHFKDTSHRIFFFAILLTLSFAIIEWLGSWWSGSLALFSDAGHMVSDSFSLMIAAFAAWLARRPPSIRHSYGLGRAEVVAAWFSSFFMILISLFVMVQAIKRLQSPEDVHSQTVMILGGLGLCVNVLMAWLLSHAEDTLNLRAAVLHVMGDLLGSLATLIAGAVIHFTHWLPIDPILSIFISLLILTNSVRLLRESLLVLMEAVPKNIELASVIDCIRSIPHVQGVHDLHVWTLSSGSILLSAHIDIGDYQFWDEILQTLRSRLLDQFHIEHITVQPECVSLEKLQGQSCASQCVKK